MELDSLPYYDTDLVDHPHLRANINSLLALELRSILPKTATTEPKNLSHLSSLPTTSTSPLLAQELSRHSLKPTKNQKPLQGLDSTRYSLPTPTENNLTSIDAWKDAYTSSLAQLEHQRLRLINAQILASPVGSNAWKIQNFTLENTLARIDAEGEAIRLEVEELNRERKRNQERGGEVLQRLERKWTELISGNMQLEIGCMTLEAQVAQLHAREAELKARLGV